VAAFRSSVKAGKAPENTAVVTVLGWLSDHAAVAALLDLLDRPELRQASLNSLVAKGPDIIGAVLDRLLHSSEDSQLALIELCGRLAHRNAVPLLLNCLRTGEGEIVVRSLNALATTGDERAYGSAKMFMGHPNLRVRQAAVATLNSIGHPQTAADVKLLLGDPDPLVCESAIMVAAYFGFPECVDSLLACCDHPDERVRRVAIEHLPCLSDNRIEVRLSDALASGCAASRVAAAAALGQIGDSRSVSLLSSALDDKDAWVRYFAVRSMAQTNLSDYIHDKVARLAKNDPAMQVRIAAVDALKSQAIPTLIELATSEEDDLAVAALKSLGATGSLDALPTLTNAATTFHSRRQIEAIRAAGNLQFDEAIKVLRDIALQRDRDLAEEAIRALGGIAKEESVDALLEVMSIAAKRAAASVALRSLGEFILPFLAHRLHSLPLDVRRAVIDVLIAIRTRPAIEILETALADAGPGVRHGALSALIHVRASSQQTTEVIGREGDA
jgi:HEAT repeat protein